MLKERRPGDRKQQPDNEALKLYDMNDNAIFNQQGTVVFDSSLGMGVTPKKIEEADKSDPNRR